MPFTFDNLPLSELASSLLFTQPLSLSLSFPLSVTSSFCHSVLCVTNCAANYYYTTICTCHAILLLLSGSTDVASQLPVVPAAAALQGCL